ncbi:MAG: DUF3987 domain-containing protein [Deltaproteobacteria bacterium]|jgi:hypothetical protein|nr:DUF3987 domain-containing protein [Deltaproteobacteria bacterium]
MRLFPPGFQRAAPGVLLFHRRKSSAVLALCLLDWGVSMSIDFSAINNAALEHCPDLLFTLLPGGRLNGHEYVCSGLSGGNGDSLSVNTSSGIWKDFATDEGGSDLVSLVAAARRIGQGEAARALAEMTGTTGVPSASHHQNGKHEDRPAAITPVPGDTPKPAMTHPRLGEPSAVFEYRSQAGRLLGYVCRFNKLTVKGNGKSEKEFCPLSYTARGWRWQALPEPRPLYGLEKLAQANPESSILVLEGEGKANAVQRVIGAQVAVLSLNGGSSGVAKLNCSPLQGKKVIYWPDADEPGHKAAKAFILKAKEAGAASVEVVAPPKDVPSGWDAGDAVKEGWSRARLIAHIKDSQLADVPVDANGFPEPESMESRILPPPPSVPLDAFPLEVRAILEEAAEAFTVPLQIPATCLLSFLSCLVGRSRLISIKASWRESGNLWLTSVANSGMGKSPCMDAFFRVITRLEYDAKRSFDAAYADYETELVLYQVQRTAYAKEKSKGKNPEAFALSRPEEPRQRQITADDVTVEALGDILQGNPKGVLWLKDELSGLLFDLDKYSNNGGGGTKARLLSSHSLGPWKTNRTSNPARNNFIPKACVSIFGGIQPGMMSKVFEAGAGGVDEESGFLPRFMFIRAIAEAPAYWSERVFSRESIALLERIAAHLWAWDVEHDDQGREIDKTVLMSRQAKALYIEWYNAIAAEAYLSQNNALLRKLQAHALRLCLLLHSLNAALAGNDGMGLVTEDCMRRALLLADWVKEHQAQCWRFFKPEQGAKQSDPIERAIMAVVMEQAARIEADGWKIANSTEEKDGLLDLVEKKLGMPGLSAVKIGKAASGLGLTSCAVHKGDRGRTVTKEKINEFRATVGTVGTVGKAHGSKVKIADSTVGQPSATVGVTAPAWPMPTVADSAPTVDHQPETVALQGAPTVPTVPTDSSGYNSEFDFNDPNFPDEVNI